MTVNITNDSVGTHHMSSSVLSNTLTQQICTEFMECSELFNNSPGHAISLFLCVKTDERVNKSNAWCVGGDMNYGEIKWGIRNAGMGARRLHS